MAEGWARHLKADRFDAYSAGIEKHGLNPRAVQVMAEVGVDITSQKSQRLEDLPTQEFDLVVTVYGHADQNCPVFPGEARVVHIPFDDPPKLARDAKGEEEALDCFRRVRDEIRAMVETLPGSQLG
jgi:arsenate reductase